MTKKGCEYCGIDDWKPLFRIIEKYEYGEPWTWSEKCDLCDCCEEDKCLCEKEYTEYDCIDCDSSYCKGCDYKPTRDGNILNLTIGIVGDKLMFEDKKDIDGDYPEGKRFVDISFCPICGRTLR